MERLSCYDKLCETDILMPLKKCWDIPNDTTLSEIRKT